MNNWIEAWRQFRLLISEKIIIFGIDIMPESDEKILWMRLSLVAANQIIKKEKDGAKRTVD